MTKVSVIIPAYNSEDYIASTLSSLSKQDKLPYEVIVINDGSTDDTLKVIKDNQYPFTIKINNTTNQGQGHARNLGVTLASGEYIYFLDSDDLVTRDFISCLSTVIEQYKHPDIIFFNGQSFLDQSNKEDGFFPSYKRSFYGYFKSSDEFLEQYSAHYKFSASPCLYILKKEIWQKNNLNFNKYYHEDEEIFFKLIKFSESYAVVNYTLFNRRIRNNSIMTESKSQSHITGYKEVISTYSKLYNISTSDKEKRILARETKSFLYQYIVMCKNMSFSLDYIFIYKVLKNIKSLSMSLRILYYILKIR
jgi:glycosyltransferase involved in cell wall biosynthesis